MTHRVRVRQGKIQNSRLEVNIVEHCNLACRSCSHLSPVVPRHAVDPDQLERTLRMLARVYHARWIRLLGGEPLLHADLNGVISGIRRAGVAERIGVVTNGTLLPELSSSFWGHVDGLEVCLYPGKELDATALKACMTPPARTELTCARYAVLKLPRHRRQEVSARAGAAS